MLPLEIFNVDYFDCFEGSIIVLRHMICFFNVLFAINLKTF